MKKTILTIAALVVTGMVANAQTEAGNMMLGGGFDVNVNNKVSWNFMPQLGYFVQDNLVVGLMLNTGGGFLQTVKSLDGKNEVSINYFTFGASLFGKYYQPLTDNFYLFGGASLGYISDGHQEKLPDMLDFSKIVDGDKVSDKNIGINIFPGFTFFPTPKWGIDFTLNNIVSFNRNTNSRKDTKGVTTSTNSNNFNFGVGLMPTLAVNYYFSK